MTEPTDTLAPTNEVAALVERLADPEAGRAAVPCGRWPPWARQQRRRCRR
jgi:hypothetical protein